MDLLKILQSQNRCLNQVIKRSTEFLNLSKQGDLSQLKKFEEYRKFSFKTIKMYDQKIKFFQKISENSKNDETTLFSIKKIKTARQNLIYSILKIDREIIKILQKEKESILEEISYEQKTNHFMRKFKSKWISEAGKKLDEKL